MSTRRMGVLLSKEFLYGSRNYILVFSIVGPIIISIIVSLIFGTWLAEKPRLGILDEGKSQLVTMFDDLQECGLEGRGKDRVETYSKGMKQRLMVARSIVNQPQILFLDEPTAGLDPTSAKAIHNIIIQERERGATVFLTTHDMMEADKLSDRVSFMNHGMIVALDTPLNLKQQYGKRALKAKIITPGGKLEDREIALDTAETPGSVKELFSYENVVTIHSKEATLEDIFIKITGRGLVE